MHKKIGLCLTGGGARGAYQIGAMEALEELGLFSQIKAFSGTSIGAANALVAASTSVQTAKDVWVNMPEENMPKIKKDKADQSNKLKRPRFDAGVYSMAVFEDILRNNTDCDALRKKEVYVTISEGGQADGGLNELVKTTLIHYLKHQSKVNYVPVHKVEDNDTIFKTVIASSSIPFFFAPVELEDKKFYDGGVYDNVPIQPLIDAGCDEIIIIYLHKHFMFNPKKGSQSVTYHEIKHKGLWMGSILKFSEKQTKKLIQAGYEETMDYFKTKQQKASDEDND